ncbi:hypothetical protein ACFQ6N_00950 [Kitasatospora sp. NPDC056446]|uniref:hypothetical protein n=1 Tax=Kitasatospora sp. NPDC056446 TaxID=3345819 RepID=UPI003694A815
MSYTARGLLVDLLSRPDGWREDGRHMADSSPQGRGAIRKALKELTQAGYYRTEKIRTPDGRIVTENHVYDTPQPTASGSSTASTASGSSGSSGGPGAARPGAGEADTGSADSQKTKTRNKEPTHPPRPAPAEPSTPPAEPPDRKPPPEPPDEQTREAVAVLFRVIRPEPRLRLGEAEARRLAPLVVPWLERGATAADLAQALLPGLPDVVRSPVGVLRYRLRDKLPPARAPQQPPGPRGHAECAQCHDPVRQPGICRPCAGLGSPKATAEDGPGAAVAAAGAARVRAALHAAKAALAPPRRPVAPNVRQLPCAA